MLSTMFYRCRSYKILTDNYGSECGGEQLDSGVVKLYCWSPAPDLMHYFTFCNDASHVALG